MAASRIYNLSAGPAILPPEVFERAASAVRELKREAHADDAEGIGMSLLEISHRSGDYEAIHNKAIELVHEVLGIPRTHRVLLLQGGASLQFAMLPLNFARVGHPACYVHTGEWSKKAFHTAFMKPRSALKFWIFGNTSRICVSLRPNHLAIVAAY